LCQCNVLFNFWMQVFNQLKNLIDQFFKLIKKLID